RRQPTRREALHQRGQIVGGIGRSQFRQGTQRQAQLSLPAVEFGRDFAAPAVRAHGATAKVIAPADSSAISNVASPSCAPVYSRDVIWNGPATVPKSGTRSCQSEISPAKKRERMSASDCASLKMPEPLTAARWTPAPASNSRQRPAESASVMSTVSLLKAIRFERSPATVTKVPPPSESSFRRRSLPFCATMPGLLVCWCFGFAQTVVRPTFRSRRENAAGRDEPGCRRRSEPRHIRSED